MHIQSNLNYKYFTLDTSIYILGIYLDSNKCTLFIVNNENSNIFLLHMIAQTYNVFFF